MENFKKIIATGLVGVTLVTGASGGLAGCSIADDGNIIPQAVVLQNQEDLQQQWKEAKEASIKQFKEWFNHYVISDETLSSLWRIRTDDGIPKSFLVTDSENKPYYSGESAVKIIKLMREYFSSLEAVDVSSITSESQIKETITSLQEECGIKIAENFNNNPEDIRFKDCPTFDEEQEQKISIFTDRNIAYVMSSNDLLSNAQVIYIALQPETATEPIVSECDTSYRSVYNDVTRDTLCVLEYYDNYESVTIYRYEQEQPVELKYTEVEINDILTELRGLGIFDTNDEFIAVCDGRNIQPEPTAGKKLVYYMN